LPVAVVEGRVSGDVEPFKVTFLVDGTIESQVSGLARDEAFRHTIGLATDGPHSFVLRASDPLGNVAIASAGSVVLDRAPPVTPTLVSPSRVVTNQPTITVRGLVAPEPSAALSGRFPSVWLRGPQGMSFGPSQPQPVTDASGRFETIADLSRLADGTYTIEVLAIDAAGNVSSASTVALDAKGVARPVTRAEDATDRLARPRAILRMLRMRSPRR
jgi:hypothetical protein